MACRRKKREPLAFKNPNPTWVMAELEKLYKEWEEWEEWAEYAPTIKGRPYDRNTHADCFANGVENIDKHDILCEKTLTFLDNNVQGHNFMFLNEYEEPHDDNLDQLHVKIPHRIKELEILRESLEYAIVPDGFWKERAKALVEKIADKAPDVAAEILATNLNGPMLGE